jgi:S-adenosyl-L-methionine hydrolase (adenosine-forming)
VPIITLTTDFSTQDWFVGTMKGVILGIAPRVTIVDLTHGIPAGDIRAGAFALAAGCRFFPKRTVHVAVVDPGVGGVRAAIAVQTADFLFVGPDNGVLSLALAREKIKSVRRLENTNYFLPPVSHTFHGRDIFAPVAAHLSRGALIHKLGPAQKDFIRLSWPQPRTQRDCIEGEVVFIDRFGNAITNIENTSLNAGCEAAHPGIDPRQMGHHVRSPAFRRPDTHASSNRLKAELQTGEVHVGRKRLCPVKAFYQSVPAGQAVAVPGSSGFLEIAVNGGSAARRCGLKIGDRVSVCWS